MARVLHLLILVLQGRAVGVALLNVGIVFLGLRGVGQVADLAGVLDVGLDVVVAVLTLVLDASLLVLLLGGLLAEEGHAEAAVDGAVVEVVLHDVDVDVVDVESPAAGRSGLSLEDVAGRDAAGDARGVEEHVGDVDLQALVVLAEDVPLGEAYADVLDEEALPAEPVALHVGAHLRGVVGGAHLVERGHLRVVLVIGVVVGDRLAGTEGPSGQVAHLEVAHRDGAHPVGPRVLDRGLEVADGFHALLHLAVDDAVEAGYVHGHLDAEAVERVVAPLEVAAVLRAQRLHGGLEGHVEVAVGVLDGEVVEQGQRAVLGEEAVFLDAETGRSEDEHLVLEHVGLGQDELADDVHHGGARRILDAGYLHRQIVGQHLGDGVGQLGGEVDVHRLAGHGLVPLVLAFLEVAVVLAELVLLGQRGGLGADLVGQLAVDGREERIEAPVAEEGVDGVLRRDLLVVGEEGAALRVGIGLAGAVEADEVGVDHELVELDGDAQVHHARRPLDEAGALEGLGLGVLLDVLAELEGPVADAHLGALLGTLGNGGLVGDVGRVDAAVVVDLDVLAHGEVLIVERVAVHADRLLDVGRLGRDAQHQVVALIDLALQLVPPDGVGQLGGLVGVDGLRGENALGRVGRVAFIEVDGVFELDGVLALALAAGKPGLAPLGADGVADEHLAGGGAGELRTGQRGLLEDVEVAFLRLGLAVLDTDVGDVVALGLPGLVLGVVETEEEHGRAPFVLDEREVEVAGRRGEVEVVGVLIAGAGRHLDGIDGGGVLARLLHHLRQIRRGDAQRGRRQPQVLILHGVALDGLVGHEVVQPDNLDVVLEGIERGVALQRGQGPGEVGAGIGGVDAGHGEQRQRVGSVEGRLGRDERRGLGHVADGEVAQAVVGHVELDGRRDLGVPLVGLQVEAVLALGQQSEDAAAIVVVEAVADEDFVELEMGEELLHLDGVQRLRLAGGHGDGLAGDMTVGGDDHDLLLREGLVDVHADMDVLLHVAVVGQPDGEELARVVDVLAGLRRQHLLDGLHGDGDVLRSGGHHTERQQRHCDVSCISSHIVTLFLYRFCKFLSECCELNSQPH